MSVSRSIHSICIRVIDNDLGLGLFLLKLLDLLPAPGANNAVGINGFTAMLAKFCVPL